MLKLFAIKMLKIFAIKKTGKSARLSVYIFAFTFLSVVRVV